MTIYNYRMRQLIDTASNWANLNPTLFSGEIGVESDTGKMKVGDGSSNWNSLLYVQPDIDTNDFAAADHDHDSDYATVAVISSAGKGVVAHGATAGTARPSGFSSIEWIGSVEPTNAVDGDTWVDTA